MKHIAHVPTIQRFLISRTLLEQEIAMRLMKQFAHGQLYEELLASLQGCFEYIFNLMTESLDTALLLKSLEQNNWWLKGLGENQGIFGVRKRLSSGERLSVEHCGDLIRFYGEVIDEASKNSGKFRNAEDLVRERANQIGWRYGGGGETVRARMNPGYVAQADKGTVWQKVADETSTNPMLRSGGRIRVRAGKYFEGGPNPFYETVPARDFQTAIFRSANVKTGSGVTQWRLAERSTVGRIDRAFGLPMGADISGTTTDTMHFLHGYANLSGDPLILMLPLATIVAGYHHSLLEVAAAMSLKKLVNYKIGFYSTLVPKHTGQAHPSRGDIVGMMSAYEKDQRNKHILVHYKNGNIAGAFVADPDELAAFADLATVDMSLWAKANRMQGFPTLGDIMQLMSSVGLRETVALRNSPLIYTPRVLR